MPRVWAEDQMDVWCGEWARTRRQVLGVDLDRLMPHERLGKMSCTLGQVMDEKVAAGESGGRLTENGHQNQSWPEVYTGISAEVNAGFKMMGLGMRQVMDAHYVWNTWPSKKKAAFVNISTVEYFKRLSRAKLFLSGVMGFCPDNLRQGWRKADHAGLVVVR